MTKHNQYRLYLDEYGTESFNPSGMQDFDKRFICVAGIVVNLEDVPALNKKIEDFKNTQIRNSYTDPDEQSAPIILHRLDIENKRGPFGILKDAKRLHSFNEEWLKLLEEIPFKIISVTIDKAALLNKPSYLIKDPYHWAAMVIIEKYIQFLKRNNGQGDIMPEERKGQKDEELQMWIDNVIEKGTYYISRAEIDLRLKAKKLKFRPKKDNIAGLQITDMIAKLCAKYTWQLKHTSSPPILKGYEQKLIAVLKSKFDCAHNGKIVGYGTKYLP